MKRPRHALLVLSLVALFAFIYPMHTTHASEGVFTNFWCSITNFFGFTCNSQSESIAPAPVPEVSVATPPPLPMPVDDYQIVNSVTETPAPNTTIIEEHNTYTTNPTTVIYQNSSSEISDSEFLDLFHKLANLISKTGQQGSVVSRDLFDKQIDKVFDRNSENVDNLQEEIRTLSTDIANSFTTDLLTVSGNATVGSDLVVTGSITAGVLDVTALSSAGALIAPYFTATSTTATSTFMGAVGIGTTTPSSKLTVVGNIDISTGSAYTYNNSDVITASTTLNNYFFGGAGNLTMTGAGNTGSGYQALLSNTTGLYNTANGYYALSANTTGISNTGIGRNALSSNTTGGFNVALGNLSLWNNTTGSVNIGLGPQTLYSNTTASDNIAIGSNTLRYNNGTGNVGIGSAALRQNTTGSYNVANGYYALYNNTSATSTTAIGAYAAQGSGYSNQGGVYIGYAAGYSAATDSDYNTLVGYKAGYGVTTGARNVFLGNSTIAASYNQITTGSNNIAIGNDVAVASPTASNQLSIGNLIFGTGLDGTGTTLSSGNIGIGTTTPSSKLTVAGDINISDPTQGYKLDNNRILYASTTNFSTLAGIGAGNSLNSTGLYNTAFGYQSLYNSTSSNNTAIGYRSLYLNTSGTNNTANGAQSLYSNTTGGNNVSNGINALFGNTTGHDNTANGYHALYFNTTGSYNTANGHALYYNTGSYNTADGYGSLFSNTTGLQNTALGYNSGRYLTDGSSVASTTDNSLFLGVNTKALTDNDQNAIVIGYDANGLGSNTVVLGNDSIVTTALKGNVGIGTTTPSTKLAVVDGTGSLIFQNSSQNNLYVSGINSTVVVDAVGSSYPSFLIKVGGSIKGQLAAGTNPTGVGLYAGGSSNGIDVLGNGNIGIGTSTPSSKLTVTQSAQTATGGLWLSTSDNTDFRSQYMNTSGVLSFYGGDTAGTLNTATLNAAGEWTNASDISYKENIEKLSYGLDTVLALQPRSYDIKNTNNHRIGFIAQEVEEVIPEVVSGEEGSKGISYGNLVAVAISAIQELAKKVSDFATLFKSERIETNTLCVGNTCVTEAELQELLQNKSVQIKFENNIESNMNTDISDNESPVEVESVATNTDNLPVEFEEFVDEGPHTIVEIIESNSVESLEN